MIALIAGPTVVIYVFVLGLALLVLRAENRHDVERQTTRLAVNYAARFDGALREAAAVADANAGFLETAPDLTEEQLYTQLERSVSQVPYVYGAAIAFVPGTYKEGDGLFAPYVHRKGDSLARLNIDESVYDWYRDESWEWFQTPMKTGRPAWTGVYFDEGAGNVLMVTYSAPFFRDGAFRGVATVDIELPRLNETIGRHIVGDQRFYVLAPDGRFVYASEEESIGRNALDTARSSQRTDLADLVTRITGGDVGTRIIPGVAGVDPPGASRWVFYAPIESAGWGFATEILESEALGPVYRRLATALGAMALTLILIVGAVLLVSGRIARPVAALGEQVSRVASGDLSARAAETRATDEVGDLARGFNAMTAQLRDQVDRLAHEEAARQKVERDLNLAREIQRGLLPTALPDLPGYAVAGWNQPADQTGGDYFDWMTLPDGRTVFILADVTGHGVGPALIVAVCRAYVRAASQSVETPLAEVLRRVNDLLKQDIPDTHFITAVIAVVDPRDHTMAIISAGQAPILLYHAQSDEVEVMGADHPPLAVIEGVEFPDPRVYSLKPGDTLLLTTDGFFEWHDPDGKQFGIRPLSAFLKARHALDPEALIKALHKEVLAHARGAPQNDDLTAVVIKRV